jgi:protease I
MQSEEIMLEKPLLRKRVAILVENEFIYDEIAYYLKYFPKKGAQVELLSYLWGESQKEFICDIDSPNRPVNDIRTLTVNRCVSQTDPNDFDVVIMAANYCAVRLREIPPMGSVGSVKEIAEPPAVQFFAEAMENKAIVKGAMCHALWILTPRPDLLKNRKVICHTVVLADVINAGATFVPSSDHVVIDEDLVTARSAADLEAYFNAIVKVASNICRE